MRPSLIKHTPRLAISTLPMHSTHDVHVDIKAKLQKRCKTAT